MKATPIKSNKVKQVVQTVIVYSKARESAKSHFNLHTDSEIKEFMVDIGKDNFHHYKSDQLDFELMKTVPKGYPFDVFYFTFKNLKDSYLAIINYVNKANKKNFWLIKSFAKNENKVFENSFANQLQGIKKDIK